MRVKTIFFALLCLAFLFLTGQSAWAAENAKFSSSLVTTYQVNSFGQTTIEQKVTITNLTPSLFITQYALTFAGAPDLKNLSVSSNGQTIKPNMVTTNHQTSVGITFPDQVVGQGKTREIVIRYQHPDLTILNGNVLELHVPALQDPSAYTNYQVLFITPEKFGPATRITPAPSSIVQENGFYVTSFANPGKAGISAFFGQEQNLAFQLSYHLRNDSSSEALAQLALPPDTTWQRVHYEALDPAPTKIELDQDGNWIATYTLPPQSDHTVVATGHFKLSLPGFPEVPVTPPAKNHLKKLPYWDTDDERITSQSAQLHNPEAIHRWVVQSLSYGYDTLEQKTERFGASLALDRPNEATCQEFSDLFIAAARAQGIPARRITGYGLTQNSELRPLSFAGDILHAWPEYYDDSQQRWRPIDPTWEQTTGGIDYFTQFDLNHITFAINGVSSTLPLPAGAYKTTDLTAKDVDIKVSDTFPVLEPQFQLSLEPKKFLNIAVPGWYILRLTNPHGMAWYDTTVTLTTADGSQLHHTIPAILPWQTWEKSVLLAHNSTEWWQTQTVTLAAHHEESVYQRSTVSATSYHPAIGFIVSREGALILGTSSLVATLVSGSLLVLRRRRQNPVRR